MKKTLLLIACIALATAAQAQRMDVRTENEIRKRAEQEWPKDYSMQAYEIKKQKEAFYHLGQYRPSGVDSRTLDEIKKRAADEWPGDYSMQLYETKNQASAWLKLNGR
jgi:hypothetical protein